MPKYLKALSSWWIATPLLFAGASIWALAFLNPPREIKNLLNDYLQSSVRVDNGYGWGSGVYISPHMILTAKHVVDGGQITFTIIDIDGNEQVSTQVVMDNDDDLAIIFVEKASEIFFPLGAPGPMGSEVYMIGVPLETDFGITITKGMVSGHSEHLWLWDKVFTVDAWGAPGFSGGPVFQGGRVVGICVGGPNRRGTSMTVCEPALSLDSQLRTAFEPAETWH